MLFTCSKSYESMPSDWWEEDEEWMDGGLWENLSVSSSRRRNMRELGIPLHTQRVHPHHWLD